MADTIRMTLRAINWTEGEVGHVHLRMRPGECRHLPGYGCLEERDMALGQFPVHCNSINSLSLCTTGASGKEKYNELKAKGLRLEF